MISIDDVDSIDFLENENASLSEWYVYPHSIVKQDEATFFLARAHAGDEKYLGVSKSPDGFKEARQIAEQIWLCALSPDNADTLRSLLPWLHPEPVGRVTSFGFGDRLGLATPGHIQAARESRCIPVFAQQSVRENARAHRTPQMVLDDATWGVFQEGWRAPWGADADHIKEFADIEHFITAGYTTFTFDPGDYVDGSADADPPEALQNKMRALPWERLHSSPEAQYRRYLGHAFDLEDRRLTFDEDILLRASAKYSCAIAHAVAMYQYLVEHIGDRPFEVEVSVDETETPTTTCEHFFIASELKRLGMNWVSLAPRFVGTFAKGVDYIGDLDAFARDVQGHAVVARALGPYKISLHSGSDKFSIYPSAFQATGGQVHVKTAGTSYLAALRVLAHREPTFFRAILELSRQRFETDKATYILSVEAERVPPAAALSDEQLPTLLNDFHARQLLHVAYGSVLDTYGAELKRFLTTYEEIYSLALGTHFANHLKALGVYRLDEEYP